MQDAYIATKNLIEAVKKSNHASAFLALKNGALPFAEDIDGWSAIHLAAGNGATDIIYMLLEAGVGVDHISREGATPLHVSSYNGHLDAVELFVSRGANLNACCCTDTVCNRTPLHLAARCGRADVSTFLCDKGADIEREDDNGMTPLHLAVDVAEMIRGHTPSISPSWVVEALCLNGANVNHVATKGGSVLFNATKNAEIELVKILLSFGADTSMETPYSISPLELAKTMLKTDPDSSVKRELLFILENGVPQRVVRVCPDVSVAPSSGDVYAW